MSTVHLLTQYVWPDAAPTGLYAEHLAARLQEEGVEVRLVGGQGRYRPLERRKPLEHIVHLDHYRGRRGNLPQTLAEYASVTHAFRRYISTTVRKEDVVIVTSAPPNTVTLAGAIRRRGARAIYWLQDYYPELVRGVREYAAPLRQAFRRYWDSRLAEWDTVVKIGANLGGPRENAVIIRNWPTISFGAAGDYVPRTALYLGNLGYGHHLGHFVAACENLRDQGYRITIRADGPGVGELPGWLRAEPPCRDIEESRAVLLQHEKHFVAAHPEITEAIFPSKIWNSLAAGRVLICTGFAGAMAEELEAAKIAPFHQHLEQWVELIGARRRPAQATLAAAA